MSFLYYNLSMAFKLIIFDLDGTLVDSRVDITNAINYAVKEYGIGSFSVQEITSMVGRGVTKLIEDLIKPYPEILPKDVIDKFLYYYERHLLDNTKAYPGVKEVLEELKEYKKAVISNKREYLSRKTLEGLGLLKYFEVILGSDSVPEKKPSPVPVLTVLDRLRISPAEALIVGDSDLDIMAGRAAGIKTAGVTYGYRPVEVLKDADYLINDIRELITIVKLS